MSTYVKLIIKDIGLLFYKLLAIVMIVTLGVGFTLGLMTSSPNMYYSVEKFYKETNAADVIAKTGDGKDTLLDKEYLERVKNHPLIDSAYGYFSFDDDVEFKNGIHLAQINVMNFQEGITVNQLTLIEGRLPNPKSDDIEVVIEQKQPFLIDVPLGYETAFKDKKIKVVGVVHNPWYFAFVEEISLSQQRPIEIIIYADESLLDQELYTDIAITLTGSEKYNLFSKKYRNFIFEQVNRLKKDFPELYYLRIDMNQSYAKYSSDVSIIEAIALIFPAFFLLVTILVSMASMTRIVEDQRNQIGTLRSLGYSNFKIMMKYIIFGLLSSGIGAVLGIAVGIYFIPFVVYNAYTTIYNLPPFSIQYYFSYTTIISLVMIVSVVLVTIFSVNSSLKEKPAELLKAKSPKPGQKILLEHIPFIWKKLKFKYKSTFRNIFRHKRNLFLTLIGISGSTALLLAGFGIKNSVDLAGEYQYEEMMNYDLEININNVIEIEEVNQYQQIMVFSTNAQYLDKDYISILSFEDSSLINEFIQFKSITKEQFLFNDSSVVVTQQFASKYGLDVGDQIELSIYNQDIFFRVSHIQEYYFGNLIYIAKELLDDRIPINYNKIYVKTNLTNLDDKEELMGKLKLNSSISKVMFDEDFRYSYEQTSQSMNSVIIVLVAFSCALAIIINYNLILINVHTRTKEIATLKVLGYRETEVSGYVFREALIISSFAIIIGLLLGKTLHYIIITQVDVDGILLSNQITWFSYVLTFLLSLVFLGIVYCLSIPQTKKINMIEALKSYE